MDANRFDRLARVLGVAGSRRATLSALVTALSAPLLGDDDAEAGRRRRKRGHDRDRRGRRHDRSRSTVEAEKKKKKKKKKGCPGGKTKCGKKCVDTKADAANCGGCGRACAAPGSCETGVCTCPGGVFCDDVCVQGGVCCDADDCAAQPCKTAACTDNQCVYSPVVGHVACDGGICCDGECIIDGECCATGDCNILTCQTVECDANECVYANAAPGTECDGGICCAGVCIDPETNNDNCGACGAVCVAPDTCIDGECDCITDCSGGKICGPDGCNGQCPAGCGPNQSCTNGGTQCVCDFASCEDACCAEGEICCNGECQEFDCCDSQQCANPAFPICGDTHSCRVCTDGDECVAVGKGNLCCNGQCASGDCCIEEDCAPLACTTQVECFGNTCLYTPEPNGTVCSDDQDPGICCSGTCRVAAECCTDTECTRDDPFCDANGQCVQCLTVEDCASGECSIRSCDDGVCNLVTAPDEPTDECPTGCCGGDCCNGDQICFQGGCCEPTAGCPFGFCGMFDAGCGVVHECSTNCISGFTCCEDFCRNTDEDETHCGVCGHACADDDICNSGICGIQCADTFCAEESATPDCCIGEGGVGTCTNKQSDPSNCGQCGTVCGESQICQNGQCVNAN